MSLHGLLSVTIGVPNVEETAAYYTDFGLAPAADNWFSTVDGGPQLRIVPAPTRRLVELHVAADDMDDLGRAATNLALLGLGGQLSGASLATTEPVTGTRVYLDVAPRVHQDPPTATVYNGPGRFDRYQPHRQHGPARAGGPDALAAARREPWADPGGGRGDAAVRHLRARLAAHHHPPGHPRRRGPARGSQVVSVAGRRRPRPRSLPRPRPLRPGPEQCRPAPGLRQGPALLPGRQPRQTGDAPCSGGTDHPLPRPSPGRRAADPVPPQHLLPRPTETAGAPR